MRLLLIIALLSACESLRSGEDETLERLNYMRMSYSQCMDKLQACKNKRTLEVEETSDE